MTGRTVPEFFPENGPEESEYVIFTDEEQEELEKFLAERDQWWEQNR